VIEHIVQPGETLWAIAAQYGVPVEVILEANRLLDPYALSAGQMLYIPPAHSFVPVQQPPFFPGFPGLERRVTRLEREVNRLNQRVNRLEERVRRLEQRR